MAFTKIVHNGIKKTAYGHDEAGKPIVREFPASVSNQEIFALGMTPTKTPEPEKEPEVIPEPEKEAPEAEKPNARSRK